MIKYKLFVFYKNGFYYKYIPFCYSIVINKDNELITKYLNKQDIS